MGLVFQNVKILKDEKLVSSDVLVEAGIIKEVNQSIDIVGHEIIKGRDRFLSPGLIDPQVHFREPGQIYKEDIESGSKSAVKGGFTTVISMPNTSPTADNGDVVNYMFKKQKEIGICRVLPTGALSLGLQGKELANFSEMKDAGAVAITDDGKGVQDDSLFYQALVEAKSLNLPVLDHSEDESLSLGGAIHQGEVAKKFNIKPIDSRSESEHVKRGCDMSLETQAHYHVLHISTKESINYVKAAKERGARVTCEVSPHHLLLCDEDIAVKADGHLDANFKMNPPLRSREDMLACQDALINGVIDAIATDHAPHSPEEKMQEIHKAPFGIIGLETAFPLMYTEFVKTNKISLDRLIFLMSRGPAKIFNLDLGLLESGKVADLALIDLNESYEVKKGDFASKSQNSPFVGRSLFGRVKMTIYNGKVVYTDD